MCVCVCVCVTETLLEHCHPEIIIFSKLSTTMSDNNGFVAFASPQGIHVWYVCLTAVT